MRHLKADRKARFMRDGALRIGGRPRDNTMLDQQAVNSKFGFVSHLKNSLSIAPRGARWLEALPENCHLPPFRNRKTATPDSTVPFLFLPLEGTPASLGPGLRLHRRKVATSLDSRPIDVRADLGALGLKAFPVEPNCATFVLT
jgi:hypothetical protein